MDNELKELIEQYKKIAISSGKAIVSPNNKILARDRNKKKRLLVQMRSKGNEALQALIFLLDHENEFIRFAAANTLFKKDSKKALKVLQTIIDTSEKGFLVGHAEMALDIFQNYPEEINDEFLF